MGAYDNEFGVGLISTWVVVLLAGVGFTQAVRYFAKFPNDILFNKTLVSVVVFLLVGGMATQCAEMYLHLISHRGNPIAFTIETWPPVVAAICTSVVGFIVDQFLIRRFYIVSKNIWITGVLSLLNVVSFVMGLIIVRSFASKIGKTITLTELNHNIATLTTVWSSISVGTDIGIAACLVWTLRGMKTSFKNTNQLIQHIMIVSIQNGCTTSAVEFVGMVIHNASPGTRIDEFFNDLIAPLHLLALLSNLTLPASARDSARHGHWSAGGNPTSHSSEVAFGGVHIQRSVITTVDGPYPDLEAAYDDTTVRGTSDDVEARGKESEDPSSAYQNTEKI
ncbi:hypothetical protein C8R46DRAFT_1193125 [Mycena filopes]|nr:hypothetical protein C8R46DRAFT_1193125 [Mycena filopes]